MKVKSEESAAHLASSTIGRIGRLSQRCAPKGLSLAMLIIALHMSNWCASARGLATLIRMPRPSSARAARSCATRRSSLTGSLPLSSMKRSVRPPSETLAGSPRCASTHTGSTPSGPAITRSSGIRSSAWRDRGPVVRNLSASLAAIGYCPVFGTIPGVALCPNTPLKNAGPRIDPPMSEPSPNGEPPAPMIAPSPPELPPAMRVGSYGLLVRP